MNYIIYINDYKIDLDKNVNFNRTLQVNTIAKLSSRQSNFTSSIPVKKTANNYRFFEMLDQAGLSSDIPYILLRCQVYTSSGIPVTLKGRAYIDVVNEENIMLSLYDGYIDFLKSIQNKTLNDVDLLQLNHQKKVQTVKDSWFNNEKYIYLIADYNGNNRISINSQTHLNIDYQVPSASVEYIWNQIFQDANYSFSGSIFQTDDFKDLYITYPKPIGEEINIINITSQENTNDYTWFTDGEDHYLPRLLPNFIGDSKFVNNSPTSGTQFYDPQTDTWSGTAVAPTGEFQESGVFRLSASGFVVWNNNNYGWIKWWKSDGSPDYNLIEEGEINANDPQNNSVDIIAQAGEYLHIFVMTDSLENNGYFLMGTASNPPSNNLPGGISGLAGIETSLQFLDSFSVGFDDVFEKIKIKDFVKEVMVRFGLTPYPNPFKREIEFLTLSELLNPSNAVDYSEKYVKTLETRFVYGDYAQSNLFKYRYNEEGEDHNDGSLTIENQNLEEESTQFQSKTYSPGSELRQILGFGSFPLLKIWEREINSDSEVEYKDLKGRFYLIKKQKVEENLKIGSEELGVNDTSSHYYKANYDRCSWKEIIFDFYEDYKRIIKNSKVRTVHLKLNEVDYSIIDFKKMIYIKQLSSYFLINSVKNFVEGQPTEIELVEVKPF